MRLGSGGPTQAPVLSPFLFNVDISLLPEILDRIPDLHDCLYADDITFWGWNDVGFHGSRQIPTPNMDALAAMGVILQRHYTTPVCTPSRSAFFTSIYPARTGMQNIRKVHSHIQLVKPRPECGPEPMANLGYDVLTKAPKVAVPLTFEFLPQWLKRQGYSTHMVGKWHLGYKSLEYTPTWRGFDSFFGYYNGQEFYYNHTVGDEQGHCGLDFWRNVGHTTQVVADLNGTYSTDAFTDEAKRIIADHNTEKHPEDPHGARSPTDIGSRKRGNTSSDSENTELKSTSGDESSEDSSRLVQYRKTKRRILNGSSASSSNTVKTAPQRWTHSILFVPRNATDNLCVLNRQALSVYLENTVPNEIKNPLFLYLAYQAVHAACADCNVEAPPEIVDQYAYITAYNRSVFAGALHVMDRSVGEVLAALQSRGMLADTVVVFASDNGAAPLSSQSVSNAGNNFPLRGAKGDVWEGGVRTPAVFWYGRRSGRLPRPPSQHVMHIVDWAPTFYAAAGGDVSDLGDVDGKNQWEALTERKCIERRDVILEIEGRNEAAAIISGRYKLVNRSEGYCDALLDSRIPLPEGEPPEELDLDALMVSSEAWKALQEASADSGSRLHSAPRADWRREAAVTCSADGADDLAADDFDPCATVFVFDIFSDPCEINNLASSLPEVRDDLLGRLTTYRATILSPRPANNEADERGYPQYHNCTWSPWLDVEPSPRAECPC
nr:arylsulfatase B-like [Dermacentor andersoni]